MNLPFYYPIFIPSNPNAPPMTGAELWIALGVVGVVSCLSVFLVWYISK